MGLNIQNKKYLVAGASLMALAVLTSGCSSVDTALGRTKNAPDEFQVVVHPPLTLPPNFTLRPNQDDDLNQASQQNPQAANVQNNAVSIADQVLTSSQTADASLFDAVLGTQNRLQNIRTIVDEETLGIQIERRLPTNVLFGGEPNVGPNLDATREAIRIRRALEDGTPVNDGATPATDPVRGTQLEIE